MFPAIGSTMMQASCLPQRATASATALRSLKGAWMVSSVMALGTPGDPGMPSVATPLPAPTSRPSECPW